MSNMNIKYKKVYNIWVWGERKLQNKKIKLDEDGKNGMTREWGMM